MPWLAILYRIDCWDERIKDTAASVSLRYLPSLFTKSLKAEISAGDKSRDILNLSSRNQHNKHAANLVSWSLDNRT